MVRGVATCAILPLLGTHWALTQFSSPDLSLEFHSQLLSLLPGTMGSYLRVAFFRRSVEYCDPTATIAFGVLLSKASAQIHANVYVGPRCLLGCVTLEQDVLLGPAVQIPSGPQTHGIERLDLPIRCQPGSHRRVVIGRDSWIGAGSVVLADIGEQSVIGAGSVVTKPVAPRTIAAGNPAKPIRNRGVAEPMHFAQTTPFDNIATAAAFVTFLTI